MLHRHFIISSSSNSVNTMPNNEIHITLYKGAILDDVINWLNIIGPFNANIINIEFSDQLKRYIITCDDTITTLNSQAFSTLDINSIFLPNSIIEIGMHALNCSALESIIYDGTIKEWNLINKNELWCVITTPIIYCTDGTIEL